MALSYVPHYYSSLDQNSHKLWVSSDYCLCLIMDEFNLFLLLHTHHLPLMVQPKLNIYLLSRNIYLLIVYPAYFEYVTR